MNRALAVVLMLLVAGCDGGRSDRAAPPQVPETTLAESGVETRAASPDRSMSLISTGDGRVLLSAGFFRRVEVARIELTSRMAWAPNSGAFFINDSGNAAWSVFRLFKVDGQGGVVEDARIHQAARAELGRLNGCVSVPRDDATTRAMAWAADGRQVYVLAQPRRETGDCRWGKVGYITVAADVETGRLLEVIQEDEARRRFPELPWAPL